MSAAKEWTNVLKAIQVCKIKMACFCVTAKQSHYRHWQTLRIPGGWAPRFQDNWHMNVVRLLALHTGHLNPPPRKYSWYSFLMEAVNPRATVQPQGLCQWKIPVTPWGIETATLWVVAQWLAPTHAPAWAMSQSLKFKDVSFLIFYHCLRHFAQERRYTNALEGKSLNTITKK
jgi:hypothetical protein